MKVEGKDLEALDAVFMWPHPKVARGSLWLDDDDERKKEGVESTIRISKYAHIDLTADVHIGPWVLIDPYVQIFTHEHNIDKVDSPLLKQHQAKHDDLVTPSELWIEGDIWIFNNAIVLPQCRRIAWGSVIGAGAVVTKSLDVPFGVWAGNPARMIRKRGEERSYPSVPAAEAAVQGDLVAAGESVRVEVHHGRAVAKVTGGSNSWKGLADRPAHPTT